MLSLQYNVVSSTTNSSCQHNSTCEVCPTATHTTDHNMTIQRCVPRAPPTKLYVTRCYSFYYHTKVNLLTNRPIICNNKSILFPETIRCTEWARPTVKAVHHVPEIFGQVVAEGKRRKMRQGLLHSLWLMRCYNRKQHMFSTVYIIAYV